ncbi:MAG TPA: hypothetical protein DGN60_04830 [Chloroflexi bacterium]|nr:hypothetical protein [Chloroflexota bacterium]
MPNWLNCSGRNVVGNGTIVTNCNCTATGVTLSLKPLLDDYGIKKVFLTSMQALSGAGYPGVSSLDAIDMLYLL